jgi:hypothetical protein
MSSWPALATLRVKAQEIWEAEGHAVPLTQLDDLEDGIDPNNSSKASFKACYTSLDILDEIVKEVFSNTGTLPPITSCSKQFHSDIDSPSLGRLSTVSSWLRSYVSRVTSSATAPRPLRRVVMAFSNRVSAEYLNLVQTILDSIGMGTSNGLQGSWDGSDIECSSSRAAHKLVIDIFAHWLVLVMLLDGVWWIGGIGAW